MTDYSDEEPYQPNETDSALLSAAALMLDKLMAAPWVSAAERVTLAKAQHVLGRIPRVPNGLTIGVLLSSPPKWFDDIKTFHWWDITIEDTMILLSSGGHFYRQSTGGDSFTSMMWSINPGEEGDFSSFLDDLWMVPDVCTFPDAISKIDVKEGPYSLTVTDPENTLLEETDEMEDEEPSPTIKGAEQQTAPASFELNPIDEAEAKIAEQVRIADVEGRKPSHAYGASSCDFCGCDLDTRGLYVDGNTRSGGGWANMCIPCFNARGEGIGWGKGQLFARQSDDAWLLVAGFDPNG